MESLHLFSVADIPVGFSVINSFRSVEGVWTSLLGIGIPPVTVLERGSITANKASCVQEAQAWVRIISNFVLFCRVSCVYSLVAFSVASLSVYLPPCRQSMFSL